MQKQQKQKCSLHEKSIKFICTGQHDCKKRFLCSLCLIEDNPQKDSSILTIDQFKQKGLELLNTLKKRNIPYSPLLEIMRDIENLVERIFQDITTQVNLLKQLIKTYDINYESIKDKLLNKCILEFSDEEFDQILNIIHDKIYSTDSIKNLNLIIQQRELQIVKINENRQLLASQMLSNNNFMSLNINYLNLRKLICNNDCTLHFLHWAIQLKQLKTLLPSYLSNEIPDNQYNNEFQKEKIEKKIKITNESLRGGGCISSIPENKTINKNDDPIRKCIIPGYFLRDMVHYFNIIVNKAELTSDEKEREEIMLALQWFIMMKENFNILCFDSKSSSSVYDLIIKELPLLLKAAIIYLRISGFLCIQLLYIINDVCRILFTFFMTNDKRFLKIEEKDCFTGLVADFETQLDIESQNIWKAGAEFEITMIKAAIESFPSNSDEGKKILIQFIGGLVKSVLTMSPTDDLIDSLIQGAKFLHQSYKVQDLKKKYEVYYYFESLKWYLIQLLRQDVPVKRVLQLLRNAFQNYIENTDNWLLNFCWVQLIASLISYRPIITKLEISQNKLEQQQMWNQLIKQKFITQLSFKSNLGRVLLSQHLSNENTLTLNQLMQKLGYKPFQSFSDQLLKSLEYQPNHIFSFKERGISQFKIDYLSDIFLELDILRESIEYQINLMSLFEEKLIKINERYEKQKEVEKDKKIFYQINDENLSNIKETIENLLCVFSFNITIQNTFMLYMVRLKIIIDAIIPNNSEKELNIQTKQLLQEQVSNIEKILNEKSEVIVQQWQIEKKNVITSLVTLQVYLEQLKYQSSTLVHQQIQEQLNKATTIFKTMKQNNITFFGILEKINELKENIIQHQRNKIINFNSECSIQQFKSVIKKIINKSYMHQQIQLILAEIIEGAGETEDLNKKLIIYNSIKYYVMDFIGKLKELKETLDYIVSFIQKNKDSFQNIGISSQISQSAQERMPEDIIKELLSNQFIFFQQFFLQQEKELGNMKSDREISAEQIIQILTNDAEVLEELQTKPNPPKDLYAIRKAVAIVEKYFKRYLMNPQKISQIRELICQIYLEIKINNEEFQMKQMIGLENQINSKMINQFDDILVQLINSIDLIELANNKCQTLLNAIQDKISLFEDFQEIELKLPQQTDLNAYHSQIYEANDNLILQEICVFLTDLNIDLQITNTENNQSGQLRNQEQIGQIKIILYFFETLTQRKSQQSIQGRNIFSGLKSQFQNFIDEASLLFEDQEYKVKQCYVMSLLTILGSSQEQHIITFCQDRIVQIWALEKDERVKILLKNTELIEMQKKLFSNDLKSFSKRLESEMQEKFNLISSLEQKIYLEGDSTIRQQMQQELEINQSEFEEYLDNVNDMASKLDVGIQFLKDIKKNLAQLKQKIENLQKRVENIGDDVRKLRGKSFKELLNIRKRKVLDQMKYASLNQIYIPLKCQEWDPVSGIQIGERSILLHDSFINQEGEINEFLQNDNLVKDVLLLRGVAGSGKSRAAAKIEDFLWQKIEAKASDWTPIYVSLPTLKEPKFNLIDQALESDYYQFDKIQVKEFKEAIYQENYKIILILDSYDEMKQDCIQSNLYHTNRFQKDLFGKDANQVKEQLKVIITTRTEVLTSSNYQTWFYGDTIESLKEVELLGFDEEQQQRYLEEFTLLSLKKEILDLYSFAKQISKEKIVLEEFCNFWKKIQDYLLLNKNNNSQREDFLINAQQARQIISILKVEKIINIMSKEQITNLEKKIMELWSTYKFQKLISSAQIQHILTTPFMMEIVVQVLPSMTKKYSDASYFKEQFIQNYIQIKKDAQVSKQLIEKYSIKKLSHLSEEDLTEKDLKFKALKIWDQLQNEKYLQKFSLVDKINKNDLSTIDEAAIVIRALMMKILTVFDFYFTFAEFYHHQQIKKQQDLGKNINYESLIIDLFNFSQSLALHLTINQLTQVKYTSKGQLNLEFVQGQIKSEDDWLDTYFDDFQQNGDYKKLIRSCVLLSSKGGNYSFNHKSIQEFYVGHFLIKMLDDQKTFDETDFSSQISTLDWNQVPTKQSTMQISIEQFCLTIKESLYNRNKFNLSTENYKGVMSLLKEEIKQKKDWKSKLIQIVKLSQISEQFVRAASNSLYLLAFNNEFLGNQSLENIKISDIDLVGVSFYKSNLSSSDFQNVSISSCNFSEANLNNINWTEIQCDELHSLIGHQSNIDGILFSNDGQILISYSNANNHIFSWNIKEGKQTDKYLYSDLKKLNKFEYEQYESNFIIEKLKFSNNNQILVIQWYLFIEAYTESFDTNAIQVFDLKAKKSLGFQNFDYNVQIKDYSLSHDSNTLALCWKYKNSIEIIDLVQNKHFYLDHNNTRVNQILFTEDDEILISCCYDSRIILWNYKESQILFQFQGHKSSVESIDLSQNGQILASCSQTTIYLWNIKTFQQISQIEGHTKTINKLKFLSDGQTFISWGEDNMFMVWQTKDGKQVRCIERRTKASQDPICFSSNDKILAQQCQNQIQLWDLELGKIITIIEGQSKPIRAMQFQPDSQILASLNEKENIIHLWDVKTKKYSTQPDGHNLEVNLVGFSPDGQIIFSWGNDEQIKLWSILEGKHFKSLKNIKNCIGIEFSHQGEFLLIQSDFNYIWYFIEGRVITLNKPQVSLPVAKMSELHTNGDLLVIVEKFSKQDNSFSMRKANLKFMDLKQKKETNKMIEANQQQQNLKFSKNGELLVYTCYSQILTFNLKQNQEYFIKEDTKQIQLSQNGQMILIQYFSWEIKLYNVLTKQFIALFQNVQKTKFSPNNQILASIEQKTIIIWNAENGNQITILTGHMDKIIKLTFSSEGKKLASLDEKRESIYLWDMERFELLKILNGNQTKIKKILFSDLYQNFAAISSESYIIIWNYLEGQQLAMLEDHKQELKMALFTPNHQKFLSLDDSLIVLWDAHTWKQIKSFENNYYTYYSKKTLVLSPDGSILAMCNGRFIKILKLEEKSVHYLIGHQFNVQKIVFSSDGCSLFSSSNKENKEDCIIEWSTSTCKLESLIEGDILKREEMILSYDDQKLALKNGYCDIILYDADSGKQIALFQGHKHVIEQVIFSPNCHYLASCSRDLSIIIWDLQKLNQYAQFEGCDLIQKIIFSPDSSILVSSEMNFTVRVWNIQTKQQISKILIQTATLNFSDLSFSPDGKLLVLSNKNSLYLWNLKEDETQPLKVTTEGKYYKFSSDGNQLITYKENLSEIICFDVIKQNVMLSNKDFKGTKGQWQFFPDFNIFLQVRENKIEFYDLRNSKLLASFEEHTNKINQFSVSPDNKIIVTCSDDSTVKLTSIQDLWEKEQISKNQQPLILSSYKTLAKYSPITAQLCQIKGAQIKSTIGWDLKQLFLQKGAIKSEE